MLSRSLNELQSEDANRKLLQLGGNTYFFTRGWIWLAKMCLELFQIDAICLSTDNQLLFDLLPNTP